MKKKLIFLLLIIAHFAKAQTETVNNAVISTDTTIYSVVEQRPEYEGGEKALMRFLLENIKYPGSIENNGISDKLYLSFVVEKDGSVSAITAFWGRGKDAYRDKIVEKCLQKIDFISNPGYDDCVETDKETRNVATQFLNS